MASRPGEPPAAAVPAKPPSRAAAIARLALDAACAFQGVLGGTSGRGARWKTPDRDGAVLGAIAVARADGRFDVELHLIARPVPLHPLGERIRDRIDRDARKAGVSELVGPIHIAFEDIEEKPQSSASAGRAS